ncbi:MAG: hypothetical protein ABFS02_06215 [Pseudomonadota bacterium]
MRTALDAQLIHSFETQSPLPDRRAPVRGIEIRVSIPTGRLFKPLMRAWLLGLRDHITQDRDDADRPITTPEALFDPLTRGGNEADRPCATQAALLFHLIKLGNSRKEVEEAKELTRKLGFMLKDHPRLRPFIIGLDAAGDERRAAPRTFGEAFRQLRDFQAKPRVPTDQPDIHLGWTCHVGEDVDDLLTGLRHLDEAASLLLGNEGGRLGHALALGDDPTRFYAQRGGETEPSLGCHLLDMVWAHGRLTEARKPKSIAWIESTLRQWCGRITHCEEEMAPINKDIARTEVEQGPNIVGCFRAMQLDAKKSGAVLRDAELVKVLLPTCEAEKLMRQPVNVQANRRWIKMVTRLQSMLRKRLAHRRICIEANPTSNLLIGHYTDYTQLPYQTLIDDELALSINTDDPGLFITSLPGEFSVMYSALAQNMSHRRVLEWLAARVFDAEQSSFITAQTPVGADFPSDEKIFDELFYYTMESPWTQF